MAKLMQYALEDDLICRLADELQKEYRNGGDLSRFTVVFGGRRPAMFLKKELASRFGKGFASPRFFSMDDFIEYIVRSNGGFKRISEIESAHVIYELARQVAPEIVRNRDSFPRFYSWAGEILSFIEQLDLEDVKEPELENLKAKADLGYDVPESINSLLKSVNSMRKLYHRHQLERKSYSRGMLYLLATGYLNNSSLPEFERIYFCGLFYLHRCEQTVIKQLCDRGQGVLVLQGDHKEWPVLKKTLAVLGAADAPFSAKGGALSAKTGISFYAGFDLHSQVGIVRKLLSEISTLDSSTVVVLPEPEGIVPLLSEISSLSDDFNVSMGYPLRRSPVYSLFQFIFSAQQSRNANGCYYAKDYLRLICHPLVKNLSLQADPSVTRILVHKTEELLRGVFDSQLGGSLFVGLEEVEGVGDLYSRVLEISTGVDRDALLALLRSLHGLFFRKWENISSIKEFALLLGEVLDNLLEHSMFEGYPLNSAIINRMFELKQELEAVSFSEERFSKDDIFLLFLGRLDNEAIAFSGSPLRGLQVLGLFETRSLKFRNVIIMDANEQVLPKLRAQEPLIPREIMVGLGLNRMEKEEEIQRYMFRRLIFGAEKAHIVYREAGDTERSRFIEELIWEGQKLSAKIDLPFLPRADFKIGLLERRKKVKKTPAVLEYLGGMRYSASAVNAYLECPLKFYYRYVLGLQEREDHLKDPQGADIGNFIHDLLKEAFSGFCGKKPRIDADFREYFFKLFEDNFGMYLSRRMKSDAFMVKQIMRYRLERFLDMEGAREVEEIIALEKDFSGMITLGRRKFEFKARIDRIDRMNDGALLVLDYKTGAGELPVSFAFSSDLPWDRQLIKKRIKSFQLPVYLYFSHAEYGNDAKINAALYSLRDSDRSSALRPIFKAEEDQTAGSAALQAYWKALDFILNREILDPDLPFIPEEEDDLACTYCDFSGMCA